MPTRPPNFRANPKKSFDYFSSPRHAVFMQLTAPPAPAFAPAEKELTHKESIFSRQVASGKSNIEAIVIAYDCKNSTKKTVAEMASRCAARPHVAAEIERLRGLVEEKFVITREKLLRPLLRIVERDAEGRKVTRVTKAGDAVEVEAEADARVVPAAALICKMQGWEAAGRMELTGAGGAALQLGAVVNVGWLRDAVAARVERRVEEAGAASGAAGGALELGEGGGNGGATLPAESGAESAADEADA